MPYCIWYPDVASEDTYRQLASRYPLMRYAVGRACAVAGYTDLYLALNLRPEVSIAEEARDAGSDPIFNHIMAQPVRYRIMDDYYRKVDLDSYLVGPLNGDTCVLSVLRGQKQEFKDPLVGGDDDHWFGLMDTPGFEEMLYNITEYQAIDEEEPEHVARNYMLDLLTSPLPADLPAGNKDLLILAAAYYGDVDRYTRLRRPKPHEKEIFCVVRGNYHNSLFAIWWSRQENPPKHAPFHMPFWRYLQKSINARYIMNNDLSRIIANEDWETHPYVI